MHRLFPILICVLLSLPCEAAKVKKVKKPYPIPHGVEVIRDIEYARVGDRSLKLDLYRPELITSRLIPVVWIHGGGWQNGSKEKSVINWLPLHGYAVASVEYRLSSEALFPALVHDVKGAIRWLRANADKYHLNPSRMGTAGTSAGGHMSALMGTTGGISALEGNVGGNLEHSSRVQASIDISGMTDLYYNATVEQERCDHPETPLYKLMGGKPSLYLEKCMLASPRHQVSKDDSPVLIIHGSEDKSLVKAFQGRFLEKAYKDAGLYAEYHLMPGVGHSGLDWSNPDHKQIVLSFLDRFLKVKRKGIKDRRSYISISNRRRFGGR